MIVRIKQTEYEKTEFLDYTVLCRNLEHLTMARATHYLTYIFDCGTHEIVWRNTATAPAELASDPFFSERLASRECIWFWGGPPGAAAWFKGTLLTLLIDKLYYCAMLGYNDVVDKFSEALRNGHKTRQTETQTATGA